LIVVEISKYLQCSANFPISHPGFNPGQILKIYLTSSNIYHKISWAGILITLIGSIFFSTKAVIVKFAFNKTQVDAVSLLAVRMLFSLPFYLAAAWFTGSRKDNVKLSRKQWFSVIALGIFGYYLSSLFDFMGLKYISAGLERLILFLYPTFAVLINAFIFKEKISRLQQVALFLTYTGIALAYIGELTLNVHSPGFFRGSLFVFICAITFAVYIVGSGRMIPAIGATKFTAWVMLSSTAGVFVHFMLAGSYEIVAQSSDFIWYGLLLAIIATVIPSFLISLGMKKIGSNNVAIISSIGPVSTILQAHFILGEPVFAAQIIGTLLVVSGVVLIGWKYQREKL
jgi:drug/metabolite transporter (DMT)-like permease